MLSVGAADKQQGTREAMKKIVIIGNGFLWDSIAGLRRRLRVKRSGAVDFYGERGESSDTLRTNG